MDQDQKKKERLAQLLNIELKKGKTQSQLAREIGIQIAALNTYINSSCVPSARNLKKIADFLGMSMDNLVNYLDGEEEEAIKADLNNLDLSKTSNIKLICSYLEEKLEKREKLELAQLLIKSSLDQLVSA